MAQRRCVSEREAARLKKEGLRTSRCLGLPVGAGLQERLDTGLVWLRRRSRSAAAFMIKADGCTLLAGQPPAAGWVGHTRRLSSDLSRSGSAGSGLFQIQGEDGTLLAIVALGPAAMQGFLVFVRTKPLSPSMADAMAGEVSGWIHPAS